jgi:hypothetical protein
MHGGVRQKNWRSLEEEQEGQLTGLAAISCADGKCLEGPAPTRGYLGSLSAKGAAHALA